ncbi:acyltransferase family protein [Rubrivivax gelatinosus]|uniref:acyltransferase family protein n=1 Tax=Rubrivivax gelatinosus TaxID=28068 RepID=UPI00031A188C|nr:acyltransferase [Rubrivivax gelatinosus]MBG6079390.1 peptidoglycan/LPS O-acetylase OafA/YrhL [Rubrivivax gelatinosus]
MAEAGARPDAAARYEALDWLRGLLAASIMLYHLITWDVAPQKADTVLGRFGVYGVSMFFVLSGLSIAVAYHRFLGNWAGVWRFGVRRIFRIWPLLWLAIFTITGLLVSRGEAPSWRLVALNLTTLFGFILPTGYMNVGAWSIGNEMVYYSLSPLIVILYNRSRQLGNAFLLVTLAIGAGFAFRWMSPQVTLAAQWATYVNPFNNLFLYTAGVALYFNAKGPAWSTARVLAAMAVALGVFVLYPVAGDQALLVTGANRFVFSAASVLLVLAFFKSAIALPRLLATPLTQLGLATYGVYLLHPLVREGCRLWLPDVGAAVQVPLVAVLTVVVSVVLYHRFELPLMQLGKRLARPALVPAHAA